MGKKKKKSVMRYAAKIPAEYNPALEAESTANTNYTKFDLTVVNYNKDEQYPEYIILPKKIDKLIKKIKSLDLRPMEISLNQYVYIIRFVEVEDKHGRFSLGGEMLSNMYQNAFTSHVKFYENKEVSILPRFYELMINIIGKHTDDNAAPISKFSTLFEVCNLHSNLKECSKRIEIVHKMMKKNKKKRR